ncbi:hypothetical protein [Hyalangium rubrum]|uniref:Lipoprotein n=1 Tax=Hyalangium rubrum TaxID=3103134 RepID=A0ABU5HGQ6_9BACT|nr:hypothetical protein [Hyalangium sp. s54d21]MDY7232643.1 hypothetical protein [Hyalangium sp. s54d21]
MWGRLVLVLGWVAVLGGCTTVDVARVPADRSSRGVFVSTSDIPGPYKSMGVVQATRRGVLLFGFADPAGTDLQGTLEEQLMPQIWNMGGDGVINVRFQQTQYTLPTRILFAILFFLPLPNEATLTGEVVKLEPGGAPPGTGTVTSVPGTSL